jgi:glycosyltransferase involved in cell wall biosynthesis
VKKLIIIPAYNEAANLLFLVKEIRTAVPDFDYIVINDGSQDETRALCIEHQINAIHLPINLGIGGAVQTGYRYAFRNGYDIAVQVDGDGQHDPTYINTLINPIEAGSAQFTIGSRFVDKTGFQSSTMRRFGIRWLSGLLSIFAHVKVTDATSGFRAAGHDVIARFADRYPIDYPEPETIIELSLVGIRIVEVPVSMRERIHGTSSIRPLKAMYYMVKVTMAIMVNWLIRGNKQ